MDKINLEIEGIKEQIGLLTDRLEKLSVSSKDEAAQNMRHYVDATKDYLGRTYDSLMDKSKVAKESISRNARNADRYAHENPWPIIVGAAAVGILVGMVMRNRKE